MLVWISLIKILNIILNIICSYYMCIFILDVCWYYIFFVICNYYCYKIYVKIKDIFVLIKNFIEWYCSFSYKEILKRFIDVLLNYVFIKDNK